jgi:hypothetical protein
MGQFTFVLCFFSVLLGLDFGLFGSRFGLGAQALIGTVAVNGHVILAPDRRPRDKRSPQRRINRPQLR